MEVVLTEASSLLPPQARGAAAALPPGSPKKVGNIERVIEFISNYDSDDSIDGSTTTGEEDEDTSGQGGDVETAAVERNTPDCAAPESNPKRNVKRRKSNGEGWAPRDSNGNEPLIVFHPHHGGLVDLKHASSFDHHADRHRRHHGSASHRGPAGTISIESSQIEYDECRACLDGRPGCPPEGWVDAFLSGGQELLEHWAKLWRETYGSDEYSATGRSLSTRDVQNARRGAADIHPGCERWVSSATLSPCFTPSVSSARRA